MANDKRSWDCQLQNELARIKAQIQLESEMSRASEQMEIYELFEQAESYGNGYSKGFQDGFWAGRELFQKYRVADYESRQEMLSRLDKNRTQDMSQQSFKSLGTRFPRWLSRWMTGLRG